METNRFKLLNQQAYYSTWGKLALKFQFYKKCNVEMRNSLKKWYCDSIYQSEGKPFGQFVKPNKLKNAPFIKTFLQRLLLYRQL